MYVQWHSGASDSARVEAALKALVSWFPRGVSVFSPCHSPLPLRAYTSRVEQAIKSRATCFCTHQKIAKTRRRQTPRQRKMILTNCAACAAPLAHDAPRCVRCKLRYCDSTCQYAHAVRRRARRPLYRRVQARQGWTAVCERVLGSELFYEPRNSGLNPEPQSLLCGISDTWRSYP